MLIGRSLTGGRAARMVCKRTIRLAGPPDGPANDRGMHNRALHDSLAAFVEEAAWQLAAEVSGGAEVPFELIEQGRSTAPLYCYRPLTAAFIADRVGELGKLPSYPSARSQLAALGGLEDYLRARGVHHVPEPASARGDAALQAFLTAVWSDATDFVFEPQRFRQAFAELEESRLRGRRAVRRCSRPSTGW